MFVCQVDQAPPAGCFPDCCVWLHIPGQLVFTLSGSSPGRLQTGLLARFRHKL